MYSQQGSVGSFQGQPRPSRSGVLPNSQKGCPRCPPLVVAHDSRRCFEGLPIQGSAAPRTVRNLLGVGLASFIVVEEHPFVLPTYPPELPPEVSPPPRARTHQTSHQSSSFTNMYVDCNLHNKTCPGLWHPWRQKWSEVCSGMAHRGRAIPLVCVPPTRGGSGRRRGGSLRR